MWYSTVLFYLATYLFVFINNTNTQQPTKPRETQKVQLLAFSFRGTKQCAHFPGEKNVHEVPAPSQTQLASWPDSDNAEK